MGIDLYSAYSFILSGGRSASPARHAYASRFYSQHAFSFHGWISSVPPDQRFDFFVDLRVVLCKSLKESELARLLNEH